MGATIRHWIILCAATAVAGFGCSTDLSSPEQEPGSGATTDSAAGGGGDAEGDGDWSDNGDGAGSGASDADSTPGSGDEDSGDTEGDGEWSDDGDGAVSDTSDTDDGCNGGNDGECSASDTDQCAAGTDDCVANIATCANLDDTLGEPYECACDTGFAGDGRIGGSGCSKVDDCSPNPCMNDGFCGDEIGGFSCACRRGFTGPLCEVVNDACDCNCPPDLEPVCGVDGTTYDNQCAAHCAGVHISYDAACGNGFPPDSEEIPCHGQSVAGSPVPGLHCLESDFGQRCDRGGSTEARCGHWINAASGNQSCVCIESQLCVAEDYCPGECRDGAFCDPATLLLRYGHLGCRAASEGK